MSQKLTLTVTKRKFYKLLISLGYDVGDFDFCVFRKSKNRYTFRTICGDFTLDFFCGDFILNRRYEGRIDTVRKLTLDQIERYKLVKSA